MKTIILLLASALGLCAQEFGKEFTQGDTSIVLIKYIPAPIAMIPQSQHIGGIFVFVLTTGQANGFRISVTYDSNGIEGSEVSMVPIRTGLVSQWTGTFIALPDDFRIISVSVDKMIVTSSEQFVISGNK